MLSPPVFELIVNDGDVVAVAVVLVSAVFGWQYAVVVAAVVVVAAELRWPQSHY